MNLIGALLLVGPFWKYQIGYIENTVKRKVWVPLTILLMIIVFSLFIQIHKIPKKLNDKEFQNATMIEARKQIKNKAFVSKDSSAAFFDISIPLLPSSYIFKTKVEDVNTIYDYKDYDEGRFSIICTRIPLKSKDEFSINMLGKDFSSLTVKKCAQNQFESMICADYIKRINDTLSVKGMITMIKINRTSYHLITQYSKLDKKQADSISMYLFNMYSTFLL
jgi:hypothetical protein